MKKNASSVESAVIARIMRRTVPFMFLLYILAYLDRVNVGFAALQMKQQLQFSDTVYGLGAGIFFVGYFIFEVPSNLILERVGARVWIARIMVSWGVISACMVFVRTPWQFYAMRFLLGVAEAGFFPGVILYFTYWFPASLQARTVAAFMTAPAVSGIVGGPISGLLLQMHGIAGLAGWQWLFLLEGVPSVICGLLVLVFVTDRPENARWLSAEEKSWLLNMLKRDRARIEATHGLHSFRAITNPRVLLCCAIYFAFAAVFNGFNLWLPQILKSTVHISDLGIGFLITVPYALACIAMILWGRRSDQRGERRWHAAGAAWLCAAGLLLAAYGASAALVLCGLTVATVGIYSVLGPFWAIPASMLTGTAAAGGIALVNSVGNLGSFWGARVIGEAKGASGSYAGGLLALALSSFLCGALALLTPRLRTQGPKSMADSLPLIASVDAERAPEQ